MVRTFFLIILSVISSVAFSAPVTPQGVWQGTLGTKAIVACFNRGSSYSNGSYYYMDYLTPISLSKGPKKPNWNEYHDTGSWILDEPVNQILTGTWYHPNGSKTLKIKLNYIDGQQDDAACARHSYNAKLEVYPKVEKSKLMTFSPKRQYRELKFAGRETLELIGPEPAIKKINSVLAFKNKDQLVDNYFEQRRIFLGRHGTPAVDEHGTTLVYWDENLISVNVHTWIAGMGRNGISNYYQTWNAKTSEAIDIWQWVDDGSDSRTLNPEIEAAFLKTYKGCEHDYRGKGYYKVVLKENGLQIYEEAYGEGCEKFVTIPFEQLLPFVDSNVQAIINSIIASK